MEKLKLDKTKVRKFISRKINLRTFALENLN